MTLNIFEIAKDMAIVSALMVGGHLLSLV